MTAYIKELGSLVSRQGASAGGEKLARSQLYRQLAEQLFGASVWVTHTPYGQPNKVYLSCTHPREEVKVLCRVNLRDPVPYIIVRSTSFVALAKDICFNTSGHLIERKHLKSALKLQFSKVVLLAGLRDLPELQKHVPGKVLADARMQHRCCFFELRVLAEQAQTPLRDLVPDNIKQEIRSG